MSSANFDTLVGLLAGYASRAMENHCNRDWASHDDTASGIIYSVGPNHERIVRIKGPVIAITSVETRGDPSDTWSTMSSGEYTYKNFPEQAEAAKSPISSLIRIGFGMFAVGRTPIYAVANPGSIPSKTWRNLWWRGYENVRVKYTWGYSSIPGEITWVCIRIVDEWLKKALKDLVGKRVKAVEPEDLQLIMRYSVPDYIKAELNEWRSTGGSRAA